MILTIIAQTFIAIIGLIMSVFPVVEELPFGIHNAFATFVNSINYATDFIPFFETTWNLLLLMFAIKVTLYLFDWFKWLIGVIRG